MINKIKIFISVFSDGLKGLKRSYFSSRKDRYGFIDKTSTVFMPGQGGKQNVFLYENTIVHEYHNFITQQGKFVMKRNSIAALGLTVITAEHGVNNIGDFPGGQGWKDLVGNDVIVDEDVWLGAQVTLCPGVYIQRGVIVATGSICVKSKEYPPYSIIGGNPAKFIKFRFTLQEQIAHEKIRFSEIERIPIDILEKNYEKFTKS
jgi:virginiamycin A acetyltransferase